MKIFNKKNIEISIAVALILVIGVLLNSRLSRYPISYTWLTSMVINSRNNQNEVLDRINNSLFTYLFNSVGVLQESGSIMTSTSPYWWVNSGGKLILEDGLGKTIQGELPTDDKWRKIYSRANKEDTDNGYHPQNIFRLITKGSWYNLSEQAFFKVTSSNLSESSNRNESNGLLLFSRYIDSDNLYYTGIRVDGHVVIKKKKNGVYYTLAEKRIIAGEYNRLTSPNLIPKETWIGIKSEIRTTLDKKVEINLYTDISNTGVWELALSALDDGVDSGGIIDASGKAGIRTDFMDVLFNDYKVEELH
ncbi:MAG TPA: hypothetical protein VK153_03120 [Candidatus Paceibacterota bacterium]|nr:hypothetical protein [Candidatus Paceibacterota bacterium]